MKRIMSGLALLLWLVGCSRGVPQASGPLNEPAAPAAADPAKGQASTPPPTPAGQAPEEAYAAENAKGLTGPFWGPPGTTVLAKDGTVLSQSLQPLAFAGHTLQPIKLESITYLVHADEGKLWLDGSIYPTIDQLNLNTQPEELLPLPYHTGDTWAFSGGGRGPRVAGFEELTTPAGTFSTVVVTESGMRQWFSPGVGLVKRQSPGGAVVVAERVEQRAPEVLAQARQITPELLGILANERIYDQTGKVLANLQVTDPQPASSAGRRPAARWVDIGAPYPVAQWGTFSQGEPNWIWAFWAYEPKTRTFQPLRWIFSDGSARTEMVGFFADVKARQSTFHDIASYPTGEYSFHYVDGAMQVIGERVVYQDTEVAFVTLLTHYLNQQSFVGLFADPAVGARAYAWAYPDGRNQLSGWTPRPQPDGSWVLEQRDAKVHITLARHDNKDFRITDWRIEP